MRFGVSYPRANLSLPAVIVAVLAGLAVTARAQTVISATGGLLHYSEGRVFIDERPLLHDPTHFIHLKEGQRLRTERGRVELMLIPDVLVRLDGSAEIEMVSARLTDARVRLVSGSCTVEVRRKSASGAAEVRMPGMEVRFDRNGLYRLENGPDEASVVEVFRGKATILAGQRHYVLKPNRTLKLAQGSEEPQVEKMDRTDFAMLDEWTRVGDTGRRLSTLGQGDQAMAAVLPTQLRCDARRNCGVTGLDCVLPRPISRRSIAFTGPRISRPEVR
jgi:hypothetical protein